jgi:hypothetical protein
MQELYTVDGPNLQVVEAATNFGQSAIGDVIKTMFNLGVDGVVPFKTMTDARFESFVQQLLSLDANDSAALSMNFAKIITNAQLPK